MALFFGKVRQLLLHVQRLVGIVYVDQRMKGDWELEGWRIGTKQVWLMLFGFSLEVQSPFG